MIKKENAEYFVNIKYYCRTINLDTWKVLSDFYLQKLKLKQINQEKMKKQKQKTG